MSQQKFAGANAKAVRTAKREMRLAVSADASGGDLEAERRRLVSVKFLPTRAAKCLGRGRLVQVHGALTRSLRIRQNR